MPSSGAEFERGINRIGGDYRDFDLPSPNPAECRAACAADPRCRAFSMAWGGVVRPNPHCWLKDQVTAGTPHGGMVSGVIARASNGMEYDVDRLGSDYSDFDLVSANPADCRAACVGDPRCRAFVMTRPGAWSPQAHCWLKDQVPSPVRSGGRVSGVIER